VKNSFQFVQTLESLRVQPEDLMVSFDLVHSTHAYLPVKMEQSVPKRRHINFRRRGITQKKAYSI
jgi:hypothetical protein